MARHQALQAHQVHQAHKVFIYQFIQLTMSRIQKKNWKNFIDIKTKFSFFFKIKLCSDVTEKSVKP